MLRFEHRQMPWIRRHCQQRFVDRLAEDLQSSLSDPVADLPEEEFRSRVADAADDAAAEGFESEIDVRSFVLLALLFGRGFHRQSTVQKILRDRDIPTEQKIDHLLGRVSEADWQEARSLGASHAM